MSEKAYFPISKTFTSARTGIVEVYAPISGNLVRAFVRSSVAMSGGGALFDVNKNGSSIFGDPEDRLTIADGDSTGDVAGLSIAVTQYTDLITVDFDEFTDDATSVGSKLVIVLEFEGAGGGGSAAGCEVVLADPQTIPNNSGTLVVFDDDTVSRDDDGFYSADDDTLKIPAGRAGWYVLSANIRWEGSTSGDRWADLHDADGRVLAKARVGPLLIDDPQEMNLSAIAYFAENTVIYLQVNQDSGGALDLQSPSGETRLSIAPAGTL